MSKSRHPELWRARLREAVNRTGKKHSFIAEEAGIHPCTLSRILTGNLRHPNFQSVVRIAHATGESVGAILREKGFPYTVSERGTLMQSAEIIMHHEKWGLTRQDEEMLWRFLGRLPE